MITDLRRAWMLLFLALAVTSWLACSGSQDQDTNTADDVDDDDDDEYRSDDDSSGGSPRERRRDRADERPGDAGSDEPASDGSTGDVVTPADEGPQAPPRPEINDRAQRNIQSGIERVDRGDLPAAIREFEQALRADSNAFAAAFNLGVVRERMGQGREAREAYRRALEIQPDYERAIEALARMDVRVGHVDRALSFVEQRARRYNGNIPLMTIYADLLVQAERYRDAQQVARQVLRRNERHVPAMLVFAKANYRLGRNDLALWILEQAAEIDENNAEIFNIRGFVRLAREERLLAIDDFERAVRIAPAYAEARNNLGVQYLISGRYPQAIEQLEAARQLNPNWVSVYLNIGDAYRGAQNWSKAKLSLEKALRLDSEMPEIYYNLGALYLAATKIDGLVRTAQLQKSIEAFTRYKNMKASRLGRDDPVHRLLKDAQRSLEREQTRIVREREAAAEEARRAAAREAGEGEGEGEWEEEEGDGEWE